jgi:isocitrate dehydrogenase
MQTLTKEDATIHLFDVGVIAGAGATSRGWLLDFKTTTTAQQKHVDIEFGVVIPVEFLKDDNMTQFTSTELQHRFTPLYGASADVMVVRGQIADVKIKEVGEMQYEVRLSDAFVAQIRKQRDTYPI